MPTNKSEKTKQFIIAQSSAVFNTKGYVGTSMQDIMDVTGLTKGGIYGNFRSKEEIAYQVFDFNVKLLVGEIAKRIKTENNAPDKLKAIIKFYRSYYYAPLVPGGCPILNLAIEADDTHPGLRIKALNALDMLRQSVVHILKKGIEHEQIDKNVDPDQFATIFVALVEGGLMMSKTFQDAKYLNDCLEQLSKLVSEIKK